MGEGDDNRIEATVGLLSSASFADNAVSTLSLPDINRNSLPTSSIPLSSSLEGTFIIDRPEFVTNPGLYPVNEYLDAIYDAWKTMGPEIRIFDPHDYIIPWEIFTSLPAASEHTSDAP